MECPATAPRWASRAPSSPRLPSAARASLPASARPSTARIRNQPALRRPLNLAPVSPRPDHVCHLERQRRGIQIAAVAQNNDGQVVLREALDGGLEAHGVAVVPHPESALLGIEERTEAV